MANLAFVGGTGRLGQEIAAGLKTAEGFDTFQALVRPESMSKPEAQFLQNELGYELVPVDFQDKDALKEALTGCQVLVSTLSKGQLWKLETALVEAASEAGVSLFVPSQFGIDLDRFGSTNDIYKAKVKVVERAQELGLPVLKVTPGLFSDIIMDVLADPWEGTATLVKSDDSSPTMVSFTRRSDVGYVLAKALSDPEYKNGGVLAMAGTTMHWKEALDMLAEIMDKTFEYNTISVEEAQDQEAKLEEDSELDLNKKYKAFGLHVLAGIGTEKDGFDVSATAKNYGHPLEPLKVTFKDVYIHPDDKEEED